jgi:hypothetical protein
VIQLGGEVPTTQEELKTSKTVGKPTVVASEPTLLTKSTGSNNRNKGTKRSGQNLQGPLKSNFRNWNKPFGRKNNKNKGYRSPFSGNKSSIPNRSYSPFTEAQKRNFSRLLKETLVSDS